MTDLDLLVAEALENDVPFRRDAEADWPDVLRRAGVAVAFNGHPGRVVGASAVRRSHRRWYAAAATAAALLALSFVTPLGGAIRDTVADFSDWLRGTPGEPVSGEEQRAFDEANARSYAAFPGSPELRRLIRTEIDGVSYDLLGFRSGNSLCIRVVAAGEARGSTLTCAPVGELRHDDTPVRVLLADWPVGKGDKTARLGFETYRAPLAQVTAGIAADGVSGVELVDEHGSHRVDVVANSFLYVAPRPEVAQRVTHVRAQLADGGTVGVPFTVTPSGPGGGYGGGAGEPGGPTRVERAVKGGRIGWVDRRDERGEPLDESAREKFHLLAEAEFGRVLTPDPDSSKRIAITIGESPLLRTDAGERPKRPAICTSVLSRGTASGGCMSFDDMFPDVPFTFGYSVVGAGDQFATFAGIASDDVARLELFTATGNRIDVPLRDNAYLAEVALARLPAKLVAYDTEGRVIGIRETPRDDGPATPVGEPILRLKASAADGSLELVAYRTREGGQCWFGRGTGTARVNVGSCIGKDWREAPVRLGLLPDPAVFVYGRVRDEVKRITLRYADGDEQRIEPERDGYVLFVIPPEHRTQARRLVEFWGLAFDGKVVARQRLPDRG